MADNNVYLNNGNQRTGTEIRDTSKLTFLNSKTILQFPLGLGGEISGNASPSIPFTLFMPYKRNKFELGFYSTQQGDALFTTLPTPTFAIALPTPGTALKTQYSAEYSPFEVGQALGLAAKDIMGANGVIPNLLNKNWGGAKTAAGRALEDTAVVAGFDIVKAFAENVGIKAEEIASVVLGRATNPYSENVFKNMGFREHVFNFTFMPKTEAESKQVDDIITLFKYCMAPRTADMGLLPAGQGAFFEFPYEFQIVHSISDTTFWLLPSVLSVLDVDYSGEEVTPKLFRPSQSGAQYPTKITLTMTFKEMVLLTRERMVSGRDNFFANDEPAPANAKRFHF